jgi:hypothetical protein
LCTHRLEYSILSLFGLGASAELNLNVTLGELHAAEELSLG